MLEDQVAFLLQKYLGNYVRGLSKEALKISVWNGDVELKNMQLRPEALNALKLPVRVKAGFLGSVKLKVPWSRLGQEPVLVALDHILILAEPATQVEGSSEDAIQEAKKLRIRELETRLLESQQHLKSETNTSWLGSLISTIIGNLKLSITNIHIRYEDLESNPGHPFAAGATLSRLSAVTIDDFGKETFATGGALDRIQKFAELERFAFYFDSDIHPWSVDKPWEELLPSEWNQIFELETKGGKSDSFVLKEHSYILQPVTGDARYTKLRLDESRNTGQALQKAVVNLDSVTLCVSKDGYRDIMKLADNFAAFNKRLKYAHYRPQIPVKSDPRAWWKYAYKVVTDEMKAASGKLSWEQVLKYAKLRKEYVSHYASLLKSDMNHSVVDHKKEIEKLDRELDISVILQWRMLAHKFVEQSTESDNQQREQKTKRSWWSFGWGGSTKDENEARGFTEEDWEQLNRIIGYKEGSDEQLLTAYDRGDLLHLFFEIHMKHNASRLVTDNQVYLADLSCEGLYCSIKSYSEAKVFNLKLGSYRLSSPYGLLAESATLSDSLVGVFSYKPLDAQVDWSLATKASPCYVTYIKDSVDQIVAFFKSGTAVSQSIALETAAAVQMTIDGVKRSAQEQVTRVLKDHSRFFLDLDIAAPKITIPTKFFPDNSHPTKLLLDLGNLMLCTQDFQDHDSSEEKDLYLQFNLVLSDVSAFLVDGDYSWGALPVVADQNKSNILPVIEKCGIVVKLQQIQLENPFYPSTRLAVRLPSLGFHFSPARYHRLLEVAKIFQEEDVSGSDIVCPWNQADFEGWLSLLSWKGMGNREAVWQRRYFCLVGPFLYILENPASKSYKQFFSLLGKQVHQVPTILSGDVENVLAVCDAGQLNPKIVEDAYALIIRCDSDESRRSWQSRLQAAIYRASGSSAITGSPGISSSTGTSEAKSLDKIMMRSLSVEKLFITGVLDELRICFSCSYQSKRSFQKILLDKESPLFEFRAKGGQVELLMKANNILIGTILKSLEIEDLFGCAQTTTCRYLARSFVKSTDATVSAAPPSPIGMALQHACDDEADQNNGEDDKFFEAMDDVNIFVEQPFQREGSMSEYFSAEISHPSKFFFTNPPSFSRIAGLIPDPELESRSNKLMQTDTLDSFVKAQIIIYGQDSPLYNNVDNQVSVTLTMLTFFCHRPTIVAIMEFVESINISEENHDTESFADKSSTAMMESKTNTNDEHDSMVQEPVVKGLLWKGKNRVIFFMTLNMTTAEIVLMNEDGTSLATLSQNNLLTDIKVFPASFSIKAALGNLKISDDSLPNSHSYFWVCHMRNPGGSSFVELDFTSFSAADEDYNGFDYSLNGQLSEVRIVYLNRFVQEVVSYFMGLAPSNVESLIKLKDHISNSEKWVTESEIEGSPAVKLDLSLTNPIILMPRRTDSSDYLELDVLHITIQNTFQWLGGDKNDINAVHMEIMTIKVKDINLAVGFGTVSGQSIIQDVKGLSVIVQRSLRDLLHLIPTTEADIKVEELKASMSNKEYEIITECALANLSETPHVVPPLGKISGTSDGLVEHSVSPNSNSDKSEPQLQTWVVMKVSVSVNLVELSLHSGITRDSSLATVQASGAWLLYKSNSSGESYLFATLRGFSVIDDREGTKEESKLAIGKPGSISIASLCYGADDDIQHLNNARERDITRDFGFEPIPSMLILDVLFRKSSTDISLCIQRPKLLVALDFLLAIVEFFAPSLRTTLSNEEDDLLHIVDAIILDQPVYSQPSPEFSISPQKPLIVDDERFDHCIYDGKGGRLFLQDREGKVLSVPRLETIIYIGNGKKLQFKNVTIVDGAYLDCCIFLGANSSYSVSEDDHVYFEHEESAALHSLEEIMESGVTESNVVERFTDLNLELQAIGLELTFYSTSKDIKETLVLSNKVMHANLDIFSRIVLKSDSFEISGNVLELKVESNGIRVLEPFDTCVKFSNASGKTNIHLVVSDVFMNFSFSILRLILAVEEDIMAFLRMASKKVAVVCSQFDKIGIIQDSHKDRTFAFWRPRAPSGFAILGDCLTLNEPPAKGVIAVNTSLVRVKRPISFKLIWPCSIRSTSGGNHGSTSGILKYDDYGQEESFSVWFPIAPKGFVAVGCVVSPGREMPSLSSALCIMSTLVSPSTLKDYMALGPNEGSSENVAFWRVENSFGSFLPADPIHLNITAKPYDFRHIISATSDFSTDTTRSFSSRDNSQRHDHALQLERSAFLNSGRLFEAVASFKLIWWNQGSASRRKFSVWRPMVQPGMVYLGDIAVQGYEPPNSAIVMHDTGDETVLKVPQDFQLVGHIKKQRGIESMSFWLPQAPPGFVVLGCVASKGPPKQDDFSSLRCIRSDMVTGGQFPDESIWDASDTKVSSKPFSIWSVGNEPGTFFVRNGFKKPPKRFALKLANPNVSSGSDSTVIDAEIKTFSAAVLDDYGGLMVPLFNISFSSIGFSLHGRPDYLISTVSFSLAAKSYNDKYDAWEPLVEPIDGFLRYQFDQNAPGATTQLRMTSTSDLNLNISVSNANMICKAYSSWTNLSQIQEAIENRDAVSPSYTRRSMVDVHHRKNYYIIPVNKLGQDIFIRATEIKRISNFTKLPSGDNKLVKVPVSKDMLDSHMKGALGSVPPSMVTVIIANAELPAGEGLTNGPITLAIRLSLIQPSDTLLQQQSARTCGSIYENSSSTIALVNWGEAFFFKVDSPDNYMVEFIVTDLGRGEPVGFYSAPLKKIARVIHPDPTLNDFNYEMSWMNLSKMNSRECQSDVHENCGKIRCAVLISAREVKDSKQDSSNSKPGFIQISPTKEGPWTSVRLNYAAPAACWRLGCDVIASEVTVKDGNRYVSIRSLVSITNNTDFVIELRLKSKSSNENISSNSDKKDRGDSEFGTEEFFELEKYSPSLGWVSCSPNFPVSSLPKQQPSAGEYQGISNIELPEGWDWIDDWHVDKTSTGTDDGWIYAPDIGHINWPESAGLTDPANSARQRRWIRHRQYMPLNEKDQILIGLLKPGSGIPLPLSGLTQPYILEFRPKNDNEQNEYSWSVVLEKHCLNDFSLELENSSDICLSMLTEFDGLLYCSQTSGCSLNNKNGLWFCLSTEASEIGKDLHSNPIHDWNLKIYSPLSVTNFLPLGAEYAVIDQLPTEETVPCFKDTVVPGETVNIYNADPRDPLYLSVLPQGGWQQLHGPAPISLSSNIPSKMLTLENSFSGRIVQVIVEENHDKKHLIARVIRIYVPYWIASARCPPLIYKFIDMSGKRVRRHFSVPFRANEGNEKVLWQLVDDELVGGYTIVSALNFRHLGFSASISQPGKEQFGPAKDLTPLGDMDGSIDLHAYDTEGNCFRIFVSSKPSPYSSVPTKVISIRPFMTFTNRIGQNIYLKFNAGDQPKILSASDSIVSFTYCEGEQEKLQVKLDGTDWCCPLEIVKEDTIIIVLRKNEGGRIFLKTEIRGYDEGSRFSIVFRLGSLHGPIRIENRTFGSKIGICQAGLDDGAWVNLDPHSTTNFSWEDPYGQRLLDICIHSEINTCIPNVSLDKTTECCTLLQEHGIQFDVIESGDIKIVRFLDGRSMEYGKPELPLSSNWGLSTLPNEMQSNNSPLELVIELGILGISLIDHRPRELLYLYLEKVFISYSTGYDAGLTNRFKLIIGRLQVDNQLPLTTVPVLLAPEDIPDINHPVFKATITMNNENIDGIQVYPYVYIRVTEKCWRLNIHEPIIWALVDFYNNLRLDGISSSSSVTQVDPEIRFDLIDISEVRLKLSLETEPSHRPPGALGIWSPVLSAVGNALKIQVHLRKVMHRSRFMRKSSIAPAIVNRIRRDLIHNPLHLIFSVDVLGMTKSTLSSLSKGFAELSTDGQFLQLRSKQVWSRRITGVSDGILQGTEALAQGVAFGVSGVLRKPVESTRQYGLLGLAHGLGRAFLGILVQPLSGALDFVSLTVDGVGASFARCLEILNNRATVQRIRNPCAFHADGIVREYCEKEALGQMILYLAEASRHIGCTDLFKEPSKYAWSDCYEDHFMVPYQRIVLITSKRVMLLQSTTQEKLDRKPSKILWDVPWEEILALELAKAGRPEPSHVIIHLKNFRRSEAFVRLIMCHIMEDGEQEPQAMRICFSVRKMWRAHQSVKLLTLRVPSSQRYVQFAGEETKGGDSSKMIKPIIKPRSFSSVDSLSEDRRFIKHSVNFQKVWSSEREYKSQCTLFLKQVVDDDPLCSIWRPFCPIGYVSVGDVAHVGAHPPNVAAVYLASAGSFSVPVGYDLVWRNCPDDYSAPVSIWLPRAPDGFVTVGCVAVAGYEEPQIDSAYCVSTAMAEETAFEEQIVWTTPDSYPWSCYIYQVRSEALHFIALRQEKEESDWKPMRVCDRQSPQTSESSNRGG
ncbi:hypothetical protein J5N97_018701 [Dioscorea zingiberensis]|uniref:PH domain-containing protein n=1 Tax=Dioscorea zingiberensis TaxID=325984 RepID=A0A9D5HBY4_9LILI|nr:hypothetical protein J5N97_018701 [Dioscorea zingiberensis]